MLSNDDWRVLLPRFRDNDAEASREVSVEVQRITFAEARRMRLRRADAEDVSQDISLKLYEGHPRVEDHISGFVWRCARNGLISVVRRAR